MFCTNCGKELSDTAKFCTGCGTKVEAKPVVEVTPVVETAPAAEAAPVVVVAPVAETAQEEPAKKDKKEKKAKKEKVKKEKVKKEKNKKSGGKVAAVIITLVVLLGGGAAAGWYFYGDTLLSQFNMKKAEECFAASEFEDALDYYEKALESDDTLVDAYLKMKDIYLKDGKYEDAIAILAKGLEAVETDEDKSVLQNALETTYKAGALQYTKDNDFDAAFALLEDAKDNLSQALYMSEKTTLYMSKASVKAAEGDFYSAFAIIEEGKADTADPSFDAQKIAIYLQSADFYLGNDEHDFVISMLDEGYHATGDEALLLKMKDVYKEYAQRGLEKENYTHALSLLYEAYDKTGDETLLDDIANVYLANAENFMEDGDFEEALTVLDSGISDLDAQVLKEKKEEILENVYVYAKKVYLDDIISTMSTHTKDGSDLSIYYYDETGQISSYIAYDGEGNIVEEGYPIYEEYVEYIYDDEGLLRTITTYDDEGNFCSEFAYEYDENGNKISFVNYGATDPSVISTGEYAYDDQGRMISEHIVLIHSDEEYSNEYAYNDDDFLILVKEIYNGEVETWEGYEYNENGMKSANLTYDANGELLSKSTFAYDQTTNNILQNIIYDAAGNMTYYSEYTYDDNGKVTSSIFCSYDLEGNVTWDSTSNYMYNEMGDTVWEEHSSVSDDTYSESKYSYEYDEFGNRISRKVYLNGEFTIGYEYAYDYYGNMTLERIYGSEDTFDYRYTYEYVYEYAE